MKRAALRGGPHIRPEPGKDRLRNPILPEKPALSNRETLVSRNGEGLRPAPSRLGAAVRLCTAQGAGLKRQPRGSQGALVCAAPMPSCVIGLAMFDLEPLTVAIRDYNAIC